MKKYKITAVIADETSQWEESFFTREKTQAIEVAANFVNKIVSVFNSSLRPNETPRRLIRIISIDEIVFNS